MKTERLTILDGKLVRVVSEAIVDYGNIEPTGKGKPMPLQFTVVKTEPVDDEWPENTPGRGWSNS